MAKADKIVASDEAWDNKELGEDLEHAEVATDNFEALIDDALELHSISIRLQQSLIDDFKAIAALNGVGYQPLMRQVLTRFADCEKKRILRERAAEVREQRRIEQERRKDPPQPQKKAA